MKTSRNTCFPLVENGYSEVFTTNFVEGITTTKNKADEATKDSKVIFQKTTFWEAFATSNKITNYYLDVFNMY